MKKREANFELLRIIAMLMIITMHYLDKGGILPVPETPQYGATGYLAWGLEAFCVCAVNVYVLISAYFLAESGYRPMKVVTLWLQVVFYCVGIAAVLVMTGVLPLPGLNVYQLMNYLFPVIEEHYWFVSAYILMALLAPLMNDTLRALPRKTYQQGICMLLLLLSVSKSILPVELPTDRLGYDALWFLCLYVIGAYIRYHGAETAGGGQRSAGILFMKKPQPALAGYLLCSLAIFLSLCVVRAFYIRTGSLVRYINRQYHYNSMLCLLAAVFLFLAFRAVRIPEGKASAVICRIASASFGVYLIHEHMELRYRWPQWLGAGKAAHTPLFVLHWIISIVIVYAVCMMIDFGRQYLFEKIGKRTTSCL